MFSCFHLKNRQPSGQQLVELMCQTDVSGKQLCKDKRSKSVSWQGGTVKQIKKGYSAYSFHGRVVLIARHKIAIKKESSAAIGAAEYLASSKLECLEKQKKRKWVTRVVCDFFDKLRNKSKGFGWNKTSTVAEKLEKELRGAAVKVEPSVDRPSVHQQKEKTLDEVRPDKEPAADQKKKREKKGFKKEKVKPLEPDVNVKPDVKAEKKEEAKKTTKPQPSVQPKPKVAVHKLPDLLKGKKGAQTLIENNREKIEGLEFDFNKMGDSERGQFAAVFKDIGAKHLSNVGNKNGAFEAAQKKAYEECLTLVTYLAPEAEKGLPALQTSAAAYLIEWALLSPASTISETIVNLSAEDRSISADLIECYLSKIYAYSLEHGLPQKFLRPVNFLMNAYLEKKPEGPLSLDFLKGVMVVCSRDVNSEIVKRLLNPDLISEEKTVWARLTDDQKLILAEFEKARTTSAGASPLYEKLYQDYYKNDTNNAFRALCDEQGLQDFFPSADKKIKLVNEWKGRAPKPKEAEEAKTVKIVDRRYWRVGMSDEEYLSVLGFREKKEVSLFKGNLNSLQIGDCADLDRHAYRMLIFYLQQVDKAEKLVDFLGYQSGKDIADERCFTTPEGEKALTCIFRYATENGLEAFLKYKPPIKEARPLLQTIPVSALLLCLETLYIKKTGPNIEQRASTAIAHSLLAEYLIRNGGKTFIAPFPLPKELEHGVKLLVLGNHPLREDVKEKFGIKPDFDSK